jgi:hypothetical protein
MNRGERKKSDWTIPGCVKTLKPSTGLDVSPTKDFVTRRDFQELQMFLNSPLKLKKTCRDCLITIDPSCLLLTVPNHSLARRLDHHYQHQRITCQSEGMSNRQEAPACTDGTP